MSDPGRHVNLERPEAADLLSLRQALLDALPFRGVEDGSNRADRMAGVPFAFGFAFHLPDDRLSRVEALPQTAPRWELYDNRNQRLYLAANLALSPWPWLQIGGGVSFMSSTRAFSVG